jgi:hypothetical protein
MQKTKTGFIYFYYLRTLSDNSFGMYFAQWYGKKVHKINQFDHLRLYACKKKMREIRVAVGFLIELDYPAIEKNIK